jgi:colicin import membrane protein
VFSFKFQTKPITITKPTTNIVKATSVNKEQVELELKRLREIEENKKSKEIKRQKELEKKANEAKKKRIAEENKLKKIKKKKEEEKKKRIAEENKLKKIEKERKELEKKQKEEKQRAEEAERKRKADEEKKLKEKALQDEIEAEQLEYDKREILKYTSEIIKSIENRFNRTNLKEGLSCKILIRMIEGGKIIEANIVESSGNELFDQRAEKAVYSASPLPVPTDEKLFNKMRAIRITFDP